MPKNNGRVLLSQIEEEKWRSHRTGLENRLGTSIKLAGLFRGWIPDGFEEAKTRILYVGKATSGSFDGDEIERRTFNRKGAFWIFARDIAQAVDCDKKHIPCVAWSNISKVSRAQEKADPSLIAGLEDEASATLKSEIATTKPHIVVFVTSQFGEKVVQQVSDEHSTSEWNKSEDESNDPREADIWWKRRHDGIAVLWMRHPQGAKMAKRKYAAAKIRSLTGLSNNTGQTHLLSLQEGHHPYKPSRSI